MRSLLGTMISVWKAMSVAVVITVVRKLAQLRPWAAKDWAERRPSKTWRFTSVSAETWTFKMPNIMDPVLLVFSILGDGAILLSPFLKVQEAT